ncbi:prepilin peptidase, partial [Enterobacter quasiroggenkampii]
ELGMALFFGVTAWWIPGLASLFSLWVLAAFLLPLAMIDRQHQLLPDCLTQPLLWAGLLFHAFSHGLPLRDALLGAVAGYLSLWLVYWAFRLLTRREGLGYGDFKLLAALGAWCGWQALPEIELIAALSGIVGYLLLNKLNKNNLTIAFGPYLAFAGIAL